MSKWEHPDTPIYLRGLRDGMMRAGEERDELARQLEDARRLACHYADLLHLAHESDGIIEPDWKRR